MVLTVKNGSTLMLVRHRTKLKKVDFSKFELITVAEVLEPHNQFHEAYFQIIKSSK